MSMACQSIPFVRRRSSCSRYMLRLLRSSVTDDGCRGIEVSANYRQRLDGVKFFRDMDQKEVRQDRGQREGR